MDAEKNISNNLTLDELSEVLDSGAIIKARNLLNELHLQKLITSLTLIGVTLLNNTLN